MRNSAIITQIAKVLKSNRLDFYIYIYTYIYFENPAELDAISVYTRESHESTCILIIRIRNANFA